MASSVQHVAGHIIGAINIGQKFQCASTDPKLGLSQGLIQEPLHPWMGWEWGGIKEEAGIQLHLPLENHKVDKKLYALLAQGECWPRQPVTLLWSLLAF